MKKQQVLFESPETGNGTLLTNKEKLSFFSVNLADIPIMTLIGAFLLIFYIDIVGLNPIAVAFLFLITRVLDGVNDPLIGYIIDHFPHTKWGKFKKHSPFGKDCKQC